MTDSQSPGTAAPSPERSSETGFVPGDDTWTQWRNVFSILTGKMTDEGKEQFRVARDIRNEAADCRRCEDQRNFLLQYSRWTIWFFYLFSLPLKARFKKACALDDQLLIGCD